MTAQITANAISCPKVFIGMDIHKATWKICIQTEVFHHKTYSMPSNCSDLEKYVNDNFPAYEINLVYEAGCCGFSVARYFLNLGWNVLVVNPADVKTSDKQKYQKTDALDAKNLSNQLKMGALKSINIPTETQDQFTSLARHRTQVTKKLRQTKAHIKSFLLFHSIKIPQEYDNANWSIAFLEWLDAIQFSTDCGTMALRGKLRVYRFIKAEYLLIAKQMRKYCRENHKQDFEILQSIPGIGAYLAAVIIAECGDLRRFNTEGQFASFVGIVPGMYNSGASEKCLGITPRCRPQLRSYLIEAAWIAIRKDVEMQAYYKKHHGKNVKNIIVKVAHKMTRRILAVIKKQQPYQNNINATLNPKKMIA